MSKHTQGQWKVGSHLGQLSSWCVHMDVGDRGRGMDIVESVGGMDRDERLANARLIAAAPDLLEALEDAVKLIETITPLEGDTMRKAKAAIAKAALS